MPRASVIISDSGRSPKYSKEASCPANLKACTRHIAESQLGQPVADSGLLRDDQRPRKRPRHDRVQECECDSHSSAKQRAATESDQCKQRDGMTTAHISCQNERGAASSAELQKLLEDFEEELACPMYVPWHQLHILTPADALRTSQMLRYVVCCLSLLQFLHALHRRALVVFQPICAIPVATACAVGVDWTGFRDRYRSLKLSMRTFTFAHQLQTSKATCPVCRTKLISAAPLLPNFSLDNAVEKHVSALCDGGVKGWAPGEVKIAEWCRRNE